MIIYIKNKLLYDIIYFKLTKMYIMANENIKLITF